MDLQKSELKEFLDDLITRDQRMMFGIITMVITSDTKQKLDLDTESVLATAREKLCQLGVLKYQQMDGLNTALPYGIRKIDAMRTLTTETTAAFVPFKAQEVFHKGGIYYGLNSISKNMIIADRNQLLNANSFILGVSGGGKSFTAKKEILSLAMSDPKCEILVLDPEREYSPLIKALGGEIVRVKAVSDTHINALDINQNYGEGNNPILS